MTYHVSRIDLVVTLKFLPESFDIRLLHISKIFINFFDVPKMLNVSRIFNSFNADIRRLFQNIQLFCRNIFVKFVLP